jgi:hypothetical protein
MIIQCSWCLKMLGEKAPLKDKNLTHSICKECQKKLMNQVKGKI